MPDWGLLVEGYPVGRCDVRNFGSDGHLEFDGLLDKLCTVHFMHLKVTHFWRLISGRPSHFDHYFG